MYKQERNSKPRKRKASPGTTTPDTKPAQAEPRIHAPDATTATTAENNILSDCLLNWRLEDHLPTPEQQEQQQQTSSVVAQHLLARMIRQDPDMLAMIAQARERFLRAEQEQQQTAGQEGGEPGSPQSVTDEHMDTASPSLVSFSMFSAGTSNEPTADSLAEHDTDPSASNPAQDDASAAHPAP